MFGKYLAIVLGAGGLVSSTCTAHYSDNYLLDNGWLGLRTIRYSDRLIDALKRSQYFRR